jgi:hypothetical protein
MKRWLSCHFRVYKCSRIRSKSHLFSVHTTVSLRIQVLYCAQFQPGPRSFAREFARIDENNDVVYFVLSHQDEISAPVKYSPKDSAAIVCLSEKTFCPRISYLKLVYSLALWINYTVSKTKIKNVVTLTNLPATNVYLSEASSPPVTHTSPTLPHAHCIHVYFIHKVKGGGGELTREKVGGATVRRAGSKIST